MNYYNKKIRLNMKKILSVFLTFILLAAFCGVALAEEKIVQLTVPNCTA